MGTRTFNTRGQNIHDRLQAAIGVLFFVIMVFYAGFRGNRVVTQLPATYRTTQAPNSLPSELLQQMFPSKVPKPTYEFPALTICPTHPSATVHIAGCYILTTASKTTCDPVGVFYRTYTYEGTMLNCTSVNEFPGKPGVAGSSDDVLQVSATLSGTSNGSPDGVLVATHPQLEGKEEPRIDYENFFAASTLTMTEVVGKKIYTIDRLGNVITDYEIKASTIRLKMNATAFEESNAPFVIEFRYPRLEITYQKSFLVLDMNNWLGEVGGVAALLFFLLRAFMWIVRTLLQKSDSFAYTDLGKGYNRNEGFNNY